jgi:hypothetical protein
MSAPSVAEAMRKHLERLKALRGVRRGRRADARLAALKSWQTARLMRTYAISARTRAIATPPGFFVKDLYGPKDFSKRDAALLKIVPVMTRVLP